MTAMKAPVMGLLAALAVLATAEARPCVLPVYASGPPGSPATGADKCESSEECCGDLVCNEAHHCVPAGKTNMTAKEAAYVAHLVIEDCVNHAVAMSLDLESASQAIANASHAVKNAAGKAKDNVNKAIDKASDKAKDIAQKIKNEKDKKADQASDAKDRVSEAAGDAKDRASKNMDDLKQKSHDVIANATAHFINMKAKTSGDGGAGASGAGGASAAGDYDKFYKGYMKGASGSPNGDSKKSDSKASGSASTGGAGGAGAGFDYQKYVPGSKDSSKTVNMKKKDDDSTSASAGAGTGGSGGAGGGFDYQKYIPGSKDSSKTVNMKKKKDDSASAGASTGGAGGAGGGFDYQKYVPGSKDDDKKKKSKSDKSDSSSSSSGGAGFDYQKYVPGSKDSSKTVNLRASSNETKHSVSAGASTGGAGGAGGGFDYQKFIPGGSSSSGSSSDKSGKSKASGSAGTGGSGGAGGGFDYQKFMPGGSKMVNMRSSSSSGSSGSMASFDYSKFTGQKLANMAAAANAGTGAGGAGGAGGGFDWQKFIPKGSSDSKKGDDKTMQIPALNMTVPANGANSTNTTSTDKKDSGSDGAPCGVTPYKDFGACKKGFHCETHPLFTSFAPGKCVKKPKRRMLNARALTSKEMPVTTPGGLNGPCGIWNLGSMDFGECKDDLECVHQEHISLTFYGKTYGLPNICKNGTNVEHYAMDRPSVENVDSSDDDSSSDAEYSSYADGAMGAGGGGGADANMGPIDIDAVNKAAHNVAEKANDASLKAADEAELLAHKLLAAVAQVRAAASQLAKEAKGNATDTDDDDALHSTSSMSLVSMMELPVEVARSNFVAFSVGGLILGTAALIYRQTADARSYSRI
ncbi:Hypothetical Protein FCC1311_049942 [Hondaea fermentalgiana]|uniref:Uncharacterized protein n=1 Tax=Hondaea fermentalgiana TaxID=2315210 RepID=A0A2R5GJD6_9STRA|nr:Hypothetical Protein FCC1311_049942 [Hondaea fermentalgiana]|eukprot:GBG28773.1 Hypothetical Protein FCC1311_049942 [Hondaea fermentalgiana]